MNLSKKGRRAQRSKLKAKQARIKQSQRQSFDMPAVALTQQMLEVFKSIAKFETEDERITELLSHFVQAGALSAESGLVEFSERSLINIGIYKTWLYNHGVQSMPEAAIVIAANDAIAHMPLIEGMYQRLKNGCLVDGSQAAATPFK